THFDFAGETADRAVVPLVAITPPLLDTDLPRFLLKINASRREAPGAGPIGAARFSDRSLFIEYRIGDGNGWEPARGRSVRRGSGGCRARGRFFFVSRKYSSSERETKECGGFQHGLVGWLEIEPRLSGSR